MANVYEDAPDARQSGDVAEPVSRFRPRYRALTEDEHALHDEIKSKAVELEALFLRVKPGRYRSLSLTALEEAVMWNVKELTSESKPPRADGSDTVAGDVASEATLQKHIEEAMSDAVEVNIRRQQQPGGSLWR